MAAAESIYGPMCVGLWLDLLLLGVIFTQVYAYHTNFKRDHVWIKLYIAVIIIATVVDVVLTIVPVYSALVVHFGDVDGLETVPWGRIATPTTEAIVAFLVQIFLGWRIYILLSKKWLSATVLLLALGQFLCGIGTTIAFHMVPAYQRWDQYMPIAIVWITLSVLTNVVISSSLGFYAAKNMPPRTNIQAQLHRLILPTGALTTLFALVQLITYFASTQGVCMLFSAVLPCLYVISLLTSLNSRQGWKYSRDSQVDLSQVANVVYSDENKHRTGGNRPRFSHKPDIIPLGAMRLAEVAESDHEVQQDTKDRLSPA